LFYSAVGRFWRQRMRRCVTEGGAKDGKRFGTGFLNETKCLLVRIPSFGRNVYSQPRISMNRHLFSEYRIDLGILILRVAVGAVMFTHGLLKPLVFTLPGTMEFFEKNGFPGWTAIPVFILELVCGGFLMVGLLSRWAAAALIPVMIGALMVHWPHGWMFDRQGGGWEYIAFLTAALLSIVALGDGRFSLDTLILHGSAAFHRQILGRVGRH
jgi:putative oxidoreductase